MKPFPCPCPPFHVPHHINVEPCPRKIPIKLQSIFLAIGFSSAAKDIHPSFRSWSSECGIGLPRHQELKVVSAIGKSGLDEYVLQYQL